ncbi:MAG: hypothetical protein GVY23_03815 [Spirochaetes bacterium]|jgi:hypothetical protein|nr:hypothetical protein [Spirochaetota bacterium]
MMSDNAMSAFASYLHPESFESPHEDSILHLHPTASSTNRHILQKDRKWRRSA